MHEYIYAINSPDADKLEDVVTTMRRLGAPTIHVVDCVDHYQALEGSHRLAAASQLGLTPKLVVYDGHDIIDTHHNVIGLTMIWSIRFAPPMRLRMRYMTHGVRLIIVWFMISAGETELLITIKSV